jgi:triphosphoribosyl-dephospho-CoA synthase
MHPDTFIARKVGLKKAKQVSVEAATVLSAVGTEKGRERILQFDRMLRQQGNDYNPGTTADITAASLVLATLNGYRP